MKRTRFKLWHSLTGVTLVLAAEWGASTMLTSGIAAILILALTLITGLSIIVIATDVIEEVAQKRHMLILLAAVSIEFLVFAAFQYGFITRLDSAAFPGLHGAIAIMLQATMVFAFNPIYLPGTDVGRLLLLITTLESLVLALFVLQNIWQLHRQAGK